MNVSSFYCMKLDFTQLRAAVGYLKVFVNIFRETKMETLLQFSLL